MNLLTYDQAAKLVAAYNDTNGDVNEAARTIKKPYDQCLEVLDWLWRFDFSLDPTGATSPTTARQLLPTLTKGRWANYLYAHNVRPEVAAVLLRWTVHDVLHSCGGPTQWAKSKERKLIARVGRKTATALDDKLDEDEDAPSEIPGVGDPTPEEIEREVRAIQAAWTPAQRASAAAAKRSAPEIFRWVDTRR